MPVIFQVGPESRLAAQTLTHLFSSQQFFKNKTKLLLIIWVFLEISIKSFVKGMQISSEVGLYQVNLLKFETDFDCSPEKYHY